MGKVEKPLHFLLMDESEDERRLVEGVLVEGGEDIVISHASNPDEARELVGGGQKFDVVFASRNYRLGHELGLTVIEEFASMGENRPYIAYYADVTPDLQAGIEDAARSSGADEILFNLDVDRIGEMPSRVVLWREQASNVSEGI